MIAAELPTRVRYKRIAIRRWIVLFLRWFLPIGSVLFIAALFAREFLEIKIPGLESGTVRLNGRSLVIESPVFRGFLGDGTAYTLTSSEVEQSLNTQKETSFSKVDLVLRFEDGANLTLNSEVAEYQPDAQEVEFLERVTVVHSDGMIGEFSGGTTNLLKQSLLARGPVSVRFDEGTTLDAEAAHLDGLNSIWTFEKVKLRIVQ